MNDPLLVRSLERIGELSRDRERFVEGDGAAGNPLGEIVALDELHDEGVHVRGLFKSVDRRDAGMIQRGEDFGFLLKAGQPFSVLGERRRENLIATWRFSFVSVARYTWPIPPSPIWAMIS